MVRIELFEQWRGASDNSQRSLLRYDETFADAVRSRWITEADHAHAQNALLASDRRRLSLVDCASFHVMRSRMVRGAFAFDPHFAEQGFEVIPSAAGHGHDSAAG